MQPTDSTVLLEPWLCSIQQGLAVVEGWQQCTSEKLMAEAGFTPSKPLRTKVLNSLMAVSNCKTADSHTHQMTLQQRLSE